MDTAPIPVETLLAHREWVTAVARAVVRDPNAADDVAQETWLAAFRTPPKSETSLRGWFGTVVRSRARRIGRSESRRTAHESIAARAEATQSAAELAEIADTHRRVVQAVVELAEPYRQTILLRYFEGLAVEDVATRMSVPLDTARSRISRGLAKLRERLERELGGDERPLALALAPLLGGKRDSAARVAAVGSAVATTTAWAVGAAVLLVGLGAFWVMKARAVATEPVVAAAPPAPLFVPPPVPPPAPPPAPVVEETPKPVAPPVPVPEEPKPAAAAETAAQKLANVKLTIDWTAIPFADAVAELAEKTGVPIGISREFDDAFGEEMMIDRLRLDREITGTQVLKLISQLKGIEAVTEETRVVFVPSGVTRNAALPVIFPPKPDPNAPKSLTLCGYVSDDHANRIPRAAIVVAGGGPRRTIAETGDDGTFSVELTRPFPSIYADCPGRVPSQVVAVRGAYGTTFKVRLELGIGGAIVEGHVVDAEGRDAAGVRVSLAAVDAASVAAQQDEAARRATIGTLKDRSIVTDAAGRFRGAAMRPGLVLVTAFGKLKESVGKAEVTSYPPSAATLVEAGLAETKQVELRLGTGGQNVRGTLRDEKGRPVAGAVVDTRSSRTVTAADGSFSVMLEASRVSLGSAWCQIRITARDGRRMNPWVSIEPGVDLRFDPYMVPKWRIAGRVTDESGRRTTFVERVWLEPVLPWMGVWFGHDLSGWPRTLKPDGSFAFDDVQPGRYRVVATTTAFASWTMAFGASEEIAEPTNDFVFRIPKAWQAKGTLSARITDESGAPVEHAVFAIASSQDRTYASSLSDASGFAKRLAVPAGRYRTYVRDGYGTGRIIDTGFREVGASDLNLGTVAFAKTGRAKMTWTATGEVDPHTVYGSIEFLLADGWRVAAVRLFVFDGTEPVVWTLSPGRYVIRASGPNVQRVEREFVVTSGNVTEFDVPLRAAEQRLVALQFPMGPPAVGRIRVTDAAGALVHQQDLLASEFITPLLPGRYRVDVDVTETITVHGTLDVPAGDAFGELGVVLR